MGLPDLCLPVPAYDYAGLYLEMKRCREAGYRVSDDQQWWLDWLEKVGYCVAVGLGFDEAIEYLSWYVEGTPTGIWEGIEEGAG